MDTIYTIATTGSNSTIGLVGEEGGERSCTTDDSSSVSELS